MPCVETKARGLPVIRRMEADRDASADEANFGRKSALLFQPTASFAIAARLPWQVVSWEGACARLRKAARWLSI